MRLLFTGGCGYVGSHCTLEFLSRTDDEIVILDDLSTGFVENFVFLKSNFGDRVSFVQADITGVEQIFKSTKIDAVFHFAGSTSTLESMRFPSVYYSNNTANSIFIINMCLKYGVSKFVFSSTAAVYGEPPAELGSIREDFPTVPINPYGSSKLMVERVLMDVGNSSDMSYIILRYFNVAGSSARNNYGAYSNQTCIGQRSRESTHVIKIACECATGKREFMNIYGSDYDTRDGTCVRDYVHVDDLALAHLESFYFMIRTGKSDVFNVSYNSGISVMEVVNHVKRVSGVDFPVRVARRRLGDPSVLVADNSKLLSATSWVPAHDDITDIVRSAYMWEKHLS